VSDNKLHVSDHLPLGVGFIDLLAAARRLRAWWAGSVTP
jgi:hypothetical protein